MKKMGRQIRFELVVAACTVAVAGAFAHAAVVGETPSLFAALERQADVVGRQIFLGDGLCAGCHAQDAPTPVSPDSARFTPPVPQR